MSFSCRLLPLLLMLTLPPSVLADDGHVLRLDISPGHAKLHGPFARQQLLVTGLTANGRRDLTREVTYWCRNSTIATVDAQGVVRPEADGETIIVVSFGNMHHSISVTVDKMNAPLAVDFERDVQPILTRNGCNAGACHGKARGQNGFQLSLLGFDSEFDFAALTKEARGRRLFLPDPKLSLFLQKPTGELPHGGGIRVKQGGDAYQILLAWVQQGTPRRQPDTPKLIKVSVAPTERILTHNEQQQLIVTAHYEDGSTRDVTAMSAYQANESAIAGVNEHGLVKANNITGESTIMARYEGQIATAQMFVPLPESIPADYYKQLPRANFIDDLVWQKLQRLNLKPSENCPDHTFLRRVTLDIIGRIPTTEETRKFLADTAPDKRSKLVDELLTRSEFANHWANKWVDLLRPNPYRVGIKATMNYDDWIRQSFREDRSYDEFVKGLLTAQGGTFQNGAVTLFRDRRSPDELTTIVSQLFLGIRLECAKCHHHPFERWAQDDFYSFAAYFARVGRKGRGVSPPISGSEEIIFTAKLGSVKHPLTGEVLPPRPLFGETPEVDADTDPREVLADWIASKENPFFAQVMVNRVWADLMGRGIVMPVDDLRATNPPSNAALLEKLGEDFAASGFDLKHLIRRICNSKVYALSSIPNEQNIVDTRNYSRHYRQRLRAEVLLDSITQITGVEERFSAMPPGSSAKEIWTHRVESLFLDAFGRPDPNQDPPCERSGDTTVVQALHLMNAKQLAAKVSSDKSTAAALAKSEKTPAEIVEELYLQVYSRFPVKEEQTLGAEWFAEKDITRRQATEDLLWALLNTPEFVFKD